MQKDYLGEFLLILALLDYSKGISWLLHQNVSKKNNSISRVKSCKIRNSIIWRYVERKIKRERGVCSNERKEN